jgi:F0F1-type ATP synthase membrane subunit a
MMRLLAMLLVAMIVSGYYFPFTFSFLPGVNTKMVLAVIGIGLVLYEGCRKRGITFSKELMGAVVLACFFSFVCLFSIDYNRTDDYSYVTYFATIHFPFIAGK